MDYLRALKGDKKVTKAGERYGVNVNDYGFGRPGGAGIQKKDPRNFGSDMAKAATQDYDTRQSVQYGASSGNKKLEKYAENGFNSLDDVVKANNVLGRLHGKMGNGGDYSSSSDFCLLYTSPSPRDS